MDKYLTVDEAQEVLRSSKRFVYKQIENGHLNLFKIGRKSYVKEDEVQNLFKAVCKQK